MNSYRKIDFGIQTSVVEVTIFCNNFIVFQFSFSHPNLSKEDEDHNHDLNIVED